MDKDVRAPLPFDEAVAFVRVEPFDGSSFSFSHFLTFREHCEEEGPAGRSKEKALRPVKVWAPIVLLHEPESYLILRGRFYHVLCNLSSRIQLVTRATPLTCWSIFRIIPAIRENLRSPRAAQVRNRTRLKLVHTQKNENTEG